MIYSTRVHSEAFEVISLSSSSLALDVAIELSIGLMGFGLTPSCDRLSSPASVRIAAFTFTSSLWLLLGEGGFTPSARSILFESVVEIPPYIFCSYSTV